MCIDPCQRQYQDLQSVNEGEVNILARNVYLFVCHVQFPAQGAGFLLQFPNVQDKRAVVQRCCEPKSCTQRAAGEPSTKFRHMTDEQIDIAHMQRVHQNIYFFTFKTFSFGRYRCETDSRLRVNFHLECCL